MQIIQFSDAIKIADELKTDKGKVKPKHILLGNGFSIAYDPNIFTYGSLLNSAKFSKSEIKQIFAEFQTQDFEQIINVLQSSAKLLKIYNNDLKEIKTFEKDADEIKQSLIKILCSKHPERPSILSKEEYKNCAIFLSNFDKIYTLNYDLLLYWTILQDMENDCLIQNIDDGFRRGKESYLHWDIEGATDQNIYYLHGALHLFDNGSDLVKLEWSQWNSTILEQITRGLSVNQFPLFVAEGTSKQKMSKISHSAYLSRCLNSFSKITGSLFIYGHSLADNDKHILNLIPNYTKVENLFVSIFGDPYNNQNRDIINKAEELRLERQILSDRNQKIKNLNLYFYDATSARVWR